MYPNVLPSGVMASTVFKNYFLKDAMNTMEASQQLLIVKSPETLVTHPRLRVYYLIVIEYAVAVDDYDRVYVSDRIKKSAPIFVIQVTNSHHENSSFEPAFEIQHRDSTPSHKRATVIRFHSWYVST